VIALCGELLHHDASDNCMIASAVAFVLHFFLLKPALLLVQASLKIGKKAGDELGTGGTPESASRALNGGCVLRFPDSVVCPVAADEVALVH
jgi:hypothetical protein